MARINGRASHVRLAEGAEPVEYRVGVKDLPPSVRPRERLERSGPGDLSDADLLAILLGTGTASWDVLEVANLLLARLGGLPGIDRATLKELRGIPGVGSVKSIELKAAIEVGKRLVLQEPEARPKIASPRDIYHLVRAQMSGLDHEELRVLLLNTKNQVLGNHRLYSGSLNSTTVRMAELFSRPIREGAASLILVHNHPSGDPTPSPEDVRLTRDAAQAGALLDIEVLDHVVVGDATHQYVSLKERGLGFGAAR